MDRLAHVTFRVSLASVKTVAYTHSPMLVRMINPWIHIWSHPDDVMDNVTKQKQSAVIFMLLCSMIGIVVVSVLYAAGISLPDLEKDVMGQPLIKFPILLLLGSLLGVIFIHVSTAVAAWVSELSFIRGSSTATSDKHHVKIALAWSLGVFHGWIFLLALIITFVFWVSGNINGDGFNDVMFGFLLLTLLLWTLAWAAKGFDMVALCLAHVQNLSKDKAISSLILTFIITLPPFLFLWGLLPFVIII